MTDDVKSLTVTEDGRPLSRTFACPMCGKITILHPKIATWFPSDPLITCNHNGIIWSMVEVNFDER